MFLDRAELRFKAVIGIVPEAAFFLDPPGLPVGKKASAEKDVQPHVFKKITEDFPGGPGVRTLRFHLGSN